MWWRLAFPVVMIMGPRLIPRLVRTVYVVWKLTFDRRVPALLKLLLPATLLYFALPLSRLPYVGPAGYLVVLSIAVFLLLNLAPSDVVYRYAPWKAKHRPATDSSVKHASHVVEGSYHVVDEEEPPK